MKKGPVRRQWPHTHEQKGVEKSVFMASHRKLFLLLTSGKTATELSDHICEHTHTYLEQQSHTCPANGKHAAAVLHVEEIGMHLTLEGITADSRYVTDT